jgi:ubiquinol-cytochrome c reductase cytochrome c subunit
VFPVAVLLALAPWRASAAPAAQPEVQRIWLADCAVCHAPDGHGTSRGPDLRGVGRASVDFQVSSGRMPLFRPARNQEPGRQVQPSPGAQPIDPSRTLRRHAPAYDADTITDLVAYVGRLVADPGPKIPDLRPGDLAAGGELFRQNCAACHAWSGEGGALLHREAPPLQAATGIQTAEVVRVGSGQMPAFGVAALTDRQLDDLVSYVDYLDHPKDRGGSPLHHLGPVAEGAMSIVALGLVLLLCFWIGDRASE